MRVLLTRAREDAEPLAEILAQLGIDSDIEPMLAFRALGDAPLDLDGVQALVFTSANGVRMFIQRSVERSLPVYAVGDATAAAARDLGFARVESAAGDVDDLARLIATRLDPAAGALFHGAARQVAGDLQGQLEASGFTLRREILYEAVPIGSLSETAARALGEGRYDAVAFFSPRTAETFARLVAPLTGAASVTGETALPRPGCHAVCLSQAVATKVADMPWSGIRVAARPTQASLVELLGALRLDLARERPQFTRDDGSSMDEKMAEDQDKPASPETEGDKQGQPALDVIGAFGGIRPMATKLDIPVSTVQGWRERRVIPSSRHAQILEAALEHDIEVDPDVVAASAGRGEDGETEEGGTEALEKSGDTAAESPWKVGEGEAAEEKASEDSADRSGEEADSKPASEKQSESIPEALTEVAAAAAASAQVEAAPRRRSGVLTGLLLAVVLFVGGAVAAVVTKDQWEPLFGGAEDTVGPTLAALEGRVTELAEQLDGLSAGLAALQGAAQDQPEVDPAQIEALDAAVSSLAGGLRDLETAFGDLSSSQSAADTAGMPDISGLETRLSQLETNLESLASASAGASSEAGSGQPAADLGPLLARLTALESSLGEADLGQLDAVSALSSDAESTAERIAALEAQTSAAQTRVDELERTAAEAAANPPSLDGAASARHVALMLAVARLKDAVATTAPYSDQLASVGELFSDLEDAASPLAALAAGAETGMPTVEDLRSDFPVVARKIVAESAGGESDSWTAEVRRSLSSIVTLRRTGKIEGESADAIVARAEVEVGRGNLTAAVAELNALAGEKARAAADGWRSRAEQRLGADRAIERLAEMAIARIAGTGD